VAVQFSTTERLACRRTADRVGIRAAGKVVVAGDPRPWGSHCCRDSGDPQGARAMRKTARGRGGDLLRCRAMAGAHVGARIAVCAYSPRRALRGADRAEKLGETFMVILMCRRSPACRGLGTNAPQVLQRTAELIPNQLRFSAPPTLHPVGTNPPNPVWGDPLLRGGDLLSDGSPRVEWTSWSRRWESPGCRRRRCR
jgi:hypothetical protein